MESLNMPLGRSILAGALAGIVAAFAMNQFQSLVSLTSKALSPPPPEQDKQKSEDSGDDATVKTAEAISELTVDRPLTSDEKKWAGPAVHYTTGAVFGGIYGALAPKIPLLAAGRGLVYGSAVWLLADEIGVPALGFGPPPTETPLPSHVNALTSHLVYGSTTDLFRRLMAEGD